VRDEQLLDLLLVYRPHLPAHLAALFGDRRKRAAAVVGAWLARSSGPASPSRSISRVSCCATGRPRAPARASAACPSPAFSSSHSTSYHARGGRLAAESSLSIFSTSVACVTRKRAQASMPGESEADLGIAALSHELVANAIK
jgi:hypothetical protein